MRGRSYCLGVLFGAGCWLLADNAAAVPDDLLLEMDMSFLGMTVGRAELTAAVNQEGLAQRLSVETIGMARELTGFSSEVTSLARLDAAGANTLSFDTESRSKRADRKVVLRYDGNGQVVELATFKRGEQEVSEVPDALQNDTVDPLVAFAAIRAWLEEARARVPSSTSMAVFDGRRRFDLAVELVARRDANFGSDTTPILELDIALRPLAGFNDDDQQERRLTVLVSDDDALMPLIMRTRVRGGFQAALYTRRACVGAGTSDCREFSY